MHIDTWKSVRNRYKKAFLSGKKTKKPSLVGGQGSGIRGQNPRKCSTWNIFILLSLVTGLLLN